MHQPGSRIGGYEIVGILGRGRSAVTYRARRVRDGQEVALKIPHPTCLSDLTFISRFLREGTLGCRLDHRSIVRVFEAGEQGRELYLAMEVVEGTTLSFELAGRHPMPLLRGLNYGREVADALAHAHTNGVVHRNLKPNHIMLLRGGRVKVMDLGVATAYGDVALTSPDVFLGTPTYSPPEAVDPRSLDHRSDIYSLGIILFEMLEGHPPFESKSALEVMVMHRDQPFPAIVELTVALPGAVWEILERMCRKRSEERYQTAADVVDAIDGALETLSVVPKA